MSERMRERFVRLCEIPSPTGEERAVADAVAGEVRALGVEVAEDGAAAAARAGAGNLIARVPGRGEGWVMLCAHLDTVPHDGPIEVELADGVFRSRGETILGADNKAAVAVLVELAARAAATPPPAGIELVFTVAEEDGLRGAKELDLEALRSPYGFVLDHATPIGEVLTAGPTYNRVVAEFEGVEAHAGIRPEDGQSAIEAAAAAVGAMPLGRLDPETTANVGVITGGSATNVVAGHCRIEAEARSRDEARAAETTRALVDACTWAASERHCDVDVDVTEVFRGYRLRSSAAPVRVASEALRRCGHEPRELATGGGSDANALLARGFECVLLANGTEDNHTASERVGAARLDEMLAVCERIVAVAAEGEP
ncbi:MAG TPA: M20/M25/M40 family metallo-hydrolase [Solirubrobacterales bacterium]|nr:M20/M25/M40 family metallo-hydrolase [Solirubrobacterales bacterium]